MTCCVFLGPSLTLQAAREILDAVYLPPAKQGDICRAVRDHKPDAIGLIDGYFEQVSAVWHKEILWAMKLGIQVYGAASMGALRAAELQQFGMVGIGKIFEAYRSGRFPPFDEILFEDDDEVAVVHGPAELDYVESTAMVDIRASLAAAEADGVIGRACRDHLAALAKGLFYKERSYRNLLQIAVGLTELSEDLKRFETWIEEGKVSQKKLDAEALLGVLANGGRPVLIPGFKLEQTAVWQAAVESIERDP